MAMEITISANSIEKDEKCLLAFLKTEIPDKDEAGCVQIGVEKSNDEVAEKGANCDTYELRKNSCGRLANNKPEIIKATAKKNLEAAEICQFLIRLLQNWPKKRIREIDGPVMYKVLALAKEEGLFQSYSGEAFRKRIRYIVKNEKLLSRSVHSVEDKKLILDNLSKIGIGESRGPDVRKRYDEEMVKIGQFLIRLLRNWPEEKMRRMSGPPLYKILKLANEEGLFKSYSKQIFTCRVRRMLIDGTYPLDKVVDNEDDKRLILDNLPKFSIGVGTPFNRRTHLDEELSEICQFLMRLFRDWPSAQKKLETMSGRETIQKIWQLGHDEGWFQTITWHILSYDIRWHILKQRRLGDFVNNEDRQFILSNLYKIGIGTKGAAIYANDDESMERESRDLPLNLRETINPLQNNHNYSTRINHLGGAASSNFDFHTSKIVARQKTANSGPSNRKLPAEKSRNFMKINNNRFNPTNVVADKKLSKIENELKELKELFLLERKEKLSKNIQIEELSKKIDTLTEETKKQEKFAYQLQTKITKLENQNATLSYKLSSYRKYK